LACIGLLKLYSQKMQASTAILESMIKFIQAHGDERVTDIRRQAANDFTVGKEKTIEAEKKRLSEQFQKDLAAAEIQFKIEKSAQQNQQRIDKMRRINELVEGLQHEAKLKMHAKMTTDQTAYRTLLKNLLVQGLIRLIEADVTLRCRKSDVAHVEAIIDPAIKQYKELMITQVKALKGREDIPCKVKVDKEHFLPEWNEADQANSCLGGFVMYCKKNRITCSQTLDDRIAMTYQQAIPQIRTALFPSLIKPEKAKPVPHERGH